jgi:lipopolysaccharide export system protein LptA
MVVLSLLALCVFTQASTGNTKTSKQESRVYLIHADELFFDIWKNNNAQVLRGNVEFEHDGAHLYCDSANYFEQSNSFEAWGNVRMVQGDTLSLTSDYGYYDGNAKRLNAKVFDGSKKVVLRNRQTTLTTDTLYFDRNDHVGYYNDGGKIVDKTSTLTSVYGEYHVDSKDAFFTDKVLLVDGTSTLKTDTLVYNTKSKVANIVGPSDIVSGSSHIISELGFYNTQKKQAELLKRSKVMNEGSTIVADSIWYDGITGVSEAFRQVVYDDETNKNGIRCNYGYYDDLNGYALSTDSVVALEYSERDTLYLHADTFKVFTYNINTDSVYRVIHAYNKVRAYRIDIQAVCDSLVYNSKDSCMTMYTDPILWNVNQQLLGEEVQVFMKDSVVDHAHVINQAFSIEKLSDEGLFNQVSSNDMYAFFKHGEMHEGQAVDNVLVAYYPVNESDSTYEGLVRMETSKMRMIMEKKKLVSIWTPKATGVMYPMTQIPPEKKFLEGFYWFDYVRPLSKDDIFEWRPKKPGTEIKSMRRAHSTSKRTNIQPNE